MINIGALSLYICLNSSTTNVNDMSTADFSVLEEVKYYGLHNGWGWKHIWEKHREEFRTYYAEQLGRELSDEELKAQIIQDMENALRYGSRTVDTSRNVIIYERNGIKVFVSIKDENMGSIITARPAIHG